MESKQAFGAANFLFTGNARRWRNKFSITKKQKTKSIIWDLAYRSELFAYSVS